MSETPTANRPSHVLEDPSAKAVAHVYVNAFLDSAVGANQNELLEEFTSFNDEVLEKNPEFNSILTSEMTSVEQKLGVIDRVVRPRASTLFANFLSVLAKHERLGLLPLILAEAWTESERRSGKRRVQVKSAIALSDDQLNRIKTGLQTAIAAEPILIPSIDEELLGGLVIQVGDTVYDGSLRTRLRVLQQRLRERYLNEIQSGRDRFSSPEGN